MKKTVLSLCSSILLSTSLLTGAPVAADTSSYDAHYLSAAQELSAIGMFRGTVNGGFELDRAPTRSEAAIMLARLFGVEQIAEEEYKAGRLTMPFTDVSAYSSPYVAWAYQNGIANGTTATTFSPANPCTVKNYTAFLLRALGYRDDTDFDYDDTISFALSKGLYDSSMTGGTFLRDNLAGLTYQALGTDLHDGSTCLLDKLVRDGAINATAAAPIRDKITSLRILTRSSDRNHAIDMTVNMNTNMASLSTLWDSTSAHRRQTSATGNIKIRSDDPKNPALSATLTTQSDTDISVTSDIWLKDHTVYVRSGDNALKTPLDEDAYQNISALLDTQSNQVLLPFIHTLSTSGSASSLEGDITYILSLDKSFGRILEDILTLMGIPGVKIDLTKCRYTTTLHYDNDNADYQYGLMTRSDCEIAASLAMTAPTGSNAVLDSNMFVESNVSLQVNASGDSVTINWPDFSLFQAASIKQS